ncbi:glycosyltransferase [Luteipulveratus mongoliensis]|uniref:glycosyltransferase n=1 Tax=Luteipulveratus mongoliensis TaxID=571913 RepID=UPI000697AB63|nr:glycosyltransferase [Luteipulveratus mongoliensis]
MVSVLIAAHNEGHTIGPCLDRLLGDGRDTHLDVVVAANGCSDDTADQARRRGVTVVDLPSPGKAAALNAAEARATGFPRVYLDADISLSSADLRLLIAPLDRVGAHGTVVLAAVPRRAIDAHGATRPVRMYFDINARHPAYRDGLFGRGAIAISEKGRRRFTEFPLLVADDLFLDSQFSAAEKVEVAQVESVVETPRTVPDLLRRLARVRRGNSELRSAESEGDVRPRSSLSWLSAEVRRQPGLAPSAMVYVGLTLAAQVQARLARPGWGTTRTAPDSVVPT